MIQKFIEVPNTNIKEPVLSHQFADELCLMIAEDYGYAEVVWYALNLSLIHISEPTRPY